MPGWLKLAVVAGWLASAKVTRPGASRRLHKLRTEAPAGSPSSETNRAEGPARRQPARFDRGPRRQTGTRYFRAGICPQLPASRSGKAPIRERDYKSLRRQAAHRSDSRRRVDVRVEDEVEREQREAERRELQAERTRDQHRLCPQIDERQVARVLVGGLKTPIPACWKSCPFR